MSRDLANDDSSEYDYTIEVVVTCCHPPNRVKSYLSKSNILLNHNKPWDLVMCKFYLEGEVGFRWLIRYFDI